LWMDEILMKIWNVMVVTMGEQLRCDGDAVPWSDLGDEMLVVT
jgi:hypothetical protein